MLTFICINEMTDHYIEREKGTSREELEGLLLELSQKLYMTEIPKNDSMMRSELLV